MRAVLIVEAERTRREALAFAVAFGGHRPIAVADTRDAGIVLELEPVVCVVLGAPPGDEGALALHGGLPPSRMRDIPSIVAARRSDGAAPSVWSGEDRRLLLQAIDRAIGRRTPLRRGASSAMR